MSARLASIGQLRRILTERQSARLCWPGMGNMRVDSFTAGAIIAVHDKVNPELQEKLAEFVAKSPGHFMVVAKAAFAA